jgi:hypothetical protein
MAVLAYGGFVGGIRRRLHTLAAPDIVSLLQWSSLSGREGVRRKEEAKTFLPGDHCMSLRCRNSSRLGPRGCWLGSHQKLAGFWFELL